MDIISFAKASNVEAQVKVLNEMITSMASGLHYRGAVATYDDLPDDAEIGDVYSVQANNYEYVWGKVDTVEQWILLRPNLPAYPEDSGIYGLKLTVTENDKSLAWADNIATYSVNNNEVTII